MAVNLPSTFPPFPAISIHHCKNNQYNPFHEQELINSRYKEINLFDGVLFACALRGAVGYDLCAVRRMMVRVTDHIERTGIQSAAISHQGKLICFNKS